MGYFNSDMVFFSLENTTLIFSDILKFYSCQNIKTKLIGKKSYKFSVMPKPNNGNNIAIWIPLLLVKSYNTVC